MSVAKIELLAPAGTWDVLETVANGGADAVYLGGKRFNMRMLRSNFNFSDTELKDATSYLHQQGKKLYVTVNNLYYEPELDELKDYLLYLQQIEVDALIVQDAAIIKMHHELGLTVPMHASVQMGMANSQALDLLADWGFTRVILSKNLLLEEINSIHQSSNLDLEFFAHGDLCVSHAGQCYLSSYAADQSGNRGLCLKPCRWPFQLEGLQAGFDKKRHYLAHNDLCLYQYLQSLIDAGVTSFKLEGRMRGPEYLQHIVSSYRQGLDHILGTANDDGFEDSYQRLVKGRVRDFTTANLFARPGLETVGITGEREPAFISTPFPLRVLGESDYGDKDVTAINRDAGLSVKIGNIELVPHLLELGVDTLILGLEEMRQGNIHWDKYIIAQVVEMASTSSTQVVLETPRIVTQQDMPALQQSLLEVQNTGITALIVNDYGSLRLASEMGWVVWGGPGLNITNTIATGFGHENRLQRITLSLELNLPMAVEVLRADHGNELEMMVHGPLCAMISDLCLPRSTNGDEPDFCPGHCLFGEYRLVDELGQKFRIRTDEKCRNYLYYPYDLGLFPFLPDLMGAGLQHMRIEGQFYSNELVIELVQIYQQALAVISQGKWEQRVNYKRLLTLFPDGLTVNPG